MCLVVIEWFHVLQQLYSLSLTFFKKVICICLQCILRDDTYWVTFPLEKHLPSLWITHKIRILVINYDLYFLFHMPYTKIWSSYSSGNEDLPSTMSADLRTVSLKYTNVFSGFVICSYIFICLVCFIISGSYFPNCVTITTKHRTWRITLNKLKHTRRYTSFNHRLGSEFDPQDMNIAPQEQTHQRICIIRLCNSIFMI